MKKLLLAAAVAAVSLAARAEDAPKYRLKSSFKLGGEGGWDYLTYDAAGKRLFIARATRVMVVDPMNGHVVKEIPADGVHGVALAPELGKGFISNGKGNSVTVFDLKTLKVERTTKLKGQNPDAIVYDPATQRVFAFNGRSKSASVLDAEGKELSVIPLDGKPEFAVADGKGRVFVNIEDTNETVAIDAAKGAVVAAWPLKGCEEPAGLALDAAHGRLFAGCRNKVMAVIDAADGRVLATPPIGEGSDAAAFDGGLGAAFSSNGGGTLTVIHEDSPDAFSVVEDAPTEKGARTMALNPDTHDVYLVTADVKETPAAGGGRPKREVTPGTFRLLVMGRK